MHLVGVKMKQQMTHKTGGVKEKKTSPNGSQKQ